jgi:chromosome segregation ATPase
MQVGSGIVEEIKATKQSIARMEKDCEEGDTKKNRIRSKNLLKDIDIYDSKQNETIGEIERLKKTIELIRQEKSLYKNNLKMMELEIQRAEDQTEKLYQDIEFGQNNSKTSQNIILDLKVRNETDKDNYYQKIGELNRSLREHRGSSKSVVKASDKLSITNETGTALKRRLMKVITNNKEKIKLIDSYQKNMKIIDEAFTSIMEATGVSEIE